MATRRSLKEKLDSITADETRAIAETKRRASGLRAAELLKATAAECIELGISSLTDHPDMKAALAARDAAPEPERKPGTSKP